MSKCPKCGGDGSHFVPPSLGEPGFYACGPAVQEQEEPIFPPHETHEGVGRVIGKAEELWARAEPTYDGAFACPGCEELRREFEALRSALAEAQKHAAAADDLRAERNALVTAAQRLCDYARLDEQEYEAKYRDDLISSADYEEDILMDRLIAVLEEGKKT